MKRRTNRKFIRNRLLTEMPVYTGDKPTETRLRISVGNASGWLSEELLPNELPEIPAAAQTTMWLHFTGLNQTQWIVDVCNSLGIDKYTLQDIFTGEHIAKVDLTGDAICVVAQAVYRNHTSLTKENVTLVAGTNFILTCQESDAPLFDNIYDALSQLHTRIPGQTPTDILSLILNNIAGGYTRYTTEVMDEMDDIESDLIELSSQSDIVRTRIQSVRTQYLLLKKAIEPFSEEYHKLLTQTPKGINKETLPLLRDTHDRVRQAHHSIELCREMLAAVLDLYLANNDLKMNTVMKQLTVVSTIFIPLTFLVGVWGMNFDVMPELRWPFGYFTAWVVMTGIGLGMYLYLRKKKFF
ncbi:MAG: CorA family divalent cation transporter [Bacteroidales bacterium]